MHSYATFLGLKNAPLQQQIYVNTMGPLASILLNSAYNDCYVCLTPEVRCTTTEIIDERLKALRHDLSRFGLEGHALLQELTSRQWEHFVQAVYGRYVLERLDIFPDSLQQAVYKLCWRLNLSCTKALQYTRPAAQHYLSHSS